MATEQTKVPTNFLDYIKAERIIRDQVSQLNDLERINDLLTHAKENNQKAIDQLDKSLDRLNTLINELEDNR